MRQLHPMRSASSTLLPFYSSTLPDSGDQLLSIDVVELLQYFRGQFGAGQNEFAIVKRFDQVLVVGLGKN